MTTTTGRERPWRAIAYTPDPTAPRGRKRLVAGRCAAKTEAGLAGWVARQTAAGNAVDVYEVKPLELTP